MTTYNVVANPTVQLKTVKPQHTAVQFLNVRNDLDKVKVLHNITKRYPQIVALDDYYCQRTKTEYDAWLASNKTIKYINTDQWFSYQALAASSVRMIKTWDMDNQHQNDPQGRDDNLDMLFGILQECKNLIQLSWYRKLPKLTNEQHSRLLQLIRTSTVRFIEMSMSSLTLQDNKVNDSIIKAISLSSKGYLRAISYSHDFLLLNTIYWDKYL
ncbi:hypothetical protein SAMD00019534_014250 [Acytostelium subglobosum LB1]|uniref:hypothetical protein n=1 Tax=Acytostelium subglobosum LB1 TaxID=1410327 RepID=UPI000644CBAA|nr:hypothetical protein SAMD00019534_014250 [Acytostelium subglobosum LB1]GAM18250.1 hypothetical protein SAMD00019534_014250 [Acytostelium subglobosum LB1]|eukprot:XP_012758846.1 hypothetical protein SAMD00019534_014250 [Acytostelium subglobosum LB1]